MDQLIASMPVRYISTQLNGPWFDSRWSLCLMGSDKRATKKPSSLTAGWLGGLGPAKESRSEARPAKAAVVDLWSATIQQRAKAAAVVALLSGPIKRRDRESNQGPLS